MNICELGSPQSQVVSQVGGKSASLGRLMRDYPIPPGFCLMVPPGPGLDDGQIAEIEQAYTDLGRRCGQANPPVAVRSSAVDEDGAQASFAGQYETYLNITGAAEVVRAAQCCLESADSGRAQSYHRAHGLDCAARVAVLVQQFIPADISAVVFSANPCNGDMTRVVINATWGLGESLVGGSVTPDLYEVRKLDLGIESCQIAEKECMTIACPGGTREVSVPRALRHEAVLNAAQVRQLAGLALALEQSQGWPVDLECGFWHGQLYLLQCRPITTLITPFTFARAAADVNGLT
jgi:pyruvate,water dikinase